MLDAAANGQWDVVFNQVFSMATSQMAGKFGDAIHAGTSSAIARYAVGSYIKNEFSGKGTVLDLGFYKHNFTTGKSEGVLHKFQFKNWKRYLEEIQLKDIPVLFTWLEDVNKILPSSNQGEVRDGRWVKDPDGQWVRLPAEPKENPGQHHNAGGIPQKEVPHKHDIRYDGRGKETGSYHVDWKWSDKKKEWLIESVHYDRYASGLNNWGTAVQHIILESGAWTIGKYLLGSDELREALTPMQNDLDWAYRHYYLYNQ
jgi:hypothetical protein